MECFRPRTLPVSMSGVIIAIGLAKWHHQIVQLHAAVGVDAYDLSDRQVVAVTTLWAFEACSVM